MKKLLVLMLVLGMASLANAQWATSPEPFVITITAENTADYADVFIDYTLLVAAGLDINAATLTHTGALIANLFVLTAAEDGADVFGCYFGNITPWTTGTELGRLDLNGAAPNVGFTPVSLNCINGDLNVIGTVTVLIPEPATIALLCLGGLMLRRRK